MKYLKKIIPKFIKARLKNLNKNQKYEFGTHNRSYFKYDFVGVEKLIKNFSQCFQDIFVLTVLNGKKEGTYLEIGSSHPIKINNTYLLEKQYGWSGIGIELNKEMSLVYSDLRQNPVLNLDALKFDYLSLYKYFPDKTIDYLQIDIEPAQFNLEVLKKIPFEFFNIKVITFETDLYVSSENEHYAEQSRNYLQDKNFKLVKKNIKFNNHIFEDWYIHNDYFDHTNSICAFEENIDGNEIFFTNLNFNEKLLSFAKYIFKLNPRL